MEPEQIKAEVWTIVTTLVGPTMAASLAVMFVVRLLGGRRAGSLATVLAMAAAVFLGGAYTDNAVSVEKPWLLDGEHEPTGDDLWRALELSLEEKPKPDESAEAKEPAREDPPLRRMPHYWLPYVAGLAMLIEFLLPLLAIPAGPGWAARTCVALFAGRLLCPSGMRMLYPWLSWALGAVILLEWALLTALARRWLDGVIATGLGFCSVAATLVLFLIAAYPTAYNLGFLFGAALVGPALIAWIWPSDTSPAAPVMAIVLPALLLEGYNSLFEPPPIWSFVLAGLVPLALLPMWLPFLARRERWARWIPGLILPLIPAVLAVVWAVLGQPAGPVGVAE